MTESTHSILVIEDDADIARLLQINLEQDGYVVRWIADGATGIDVARTGSHDLLILDLSLPGLNGMEVCRRLRDEGHHLPILMLTARDEEADKILGLELGADDYLTKPFSIRELLARIRSLLRRVAMEQSATAGSEQAPVTIGAITLDPVKRVAIIDEAVVELTVKEFDLLGLFMAHPGRAYSRQQLLEQVWGYEHGGYEHTVNTHINRLRAKIEPDAANPNYIITVWGVGYRFIEPGDVQ
ncbi:MAG: response regulator transcription factor [Gemmatimonadetes bacterium]|nr:response regulator transcription factor [Gemmatimonadota bacterium]MBT6148751.1 response regulator transcription factor [Gemmatimonadota bacterium]MBT7864287.1 response regulator transcription factor [Gemmatimonadota bacterium]